ncbi:hypothetical protein YERSI8AC_250171 [Enterobacterales bacterium 8AC]|nr:hypothetical protein YERSI8AC_250171 [Enterobacterales bacterium 8AC]
MTSLGMSSSSLEIGGEIQLNGASLTAANATAADASVYAGNTPVVVRLSRAAWATLACMSIAGRNQSRKISAATWVHTINLSSKTSVSPFIWAIPGSSSKWVYSPLAWRLS